VVVVPVGAGGLAALDLATGEILWRRGPSGNRLGRSTPIVVGDVVVHAVGGLAGYDLETGEPRWRIDGVAAFSPIAATGDTVYAGLVSETEGFLMAVDADSGAERWRSLMVTAVFIGPAAGDDAVVAVDDVGVVHAFDPATGEERWSFGLRTRPTGTPVVLGDVVALAEEGRTEDLREREYRIVLLDLASGRFLASYEPAGSGARLPAFGRAGGRLVAFDPGDLLALEVVR
jgi:outer membrane protein assembly factor BamB